MKLSQPNHDICIPDEDTSSNAFSRTTHLGIGAHQDDLEFMALHGILECFQKNDKWFGGITCTDGAGSSRTGPYADFTDEEMKQIRVGEQRTAAQIGKFSFMAQLGYASSFTKSPDGRKGLVDDIFSILEASAPDVIYTHNPADKHATHIGVFLATLEAIRRLPQDKRPGKLLGCEVWRGLDWLPDSRKVILDVSARPNLTAALNGVFDSQIAGGKRYDLAIVGRRRANATMLDAHAVDDVTEVTYAIDLTELIKDESIDPLAFISEVYNEFVEEATVQFKAVS
ncbi:PIG-L family deacetylase [Rubellicoccus peritrichatus]|uniref:PIG-L family deacetylase n=1 Tax=Rubellicoccus peritrichatus TaxID=3080537 RepID=A0AAQ3QVH6_9BACT|nr:PIG-L family deacetylase [Puniceicoccus sp. CR14]WOO40905.1 PIG-L family deacetylase [Puniceicoccus sp. CR14]